jgi:MFS family permease
VLRFSNADIGIASSAYLAGAVLGALFFGWLTDRFGRKKLFFITLAVYLVATGATAFTWNLWTFALFRFFTGAGIGGEYTAINSTIQELVPARVRGWTDLVINGSFWIGAAIGATGSIILLNPAIIDPETGWRLAFLIGACPRPDHFVDADVASGKPALADDRMAAPRRPNASSRASRRASRLMSRPTEPLPIGCGCGCATATRR